jgi:TIR domain-containing protein
MADEFTHDVFLSHSAKDKEVVRAVAERLRTDGLKVWFDEWVLKAGDSIPAKIEEGLEHSRVLVLCMSANAFGSDWSRLESYTYRFKDPLNKERRFIPLRLDDAPIKGSLAQFLYINWLPAIREQEYAKLIAGVQGEAPWPPTGRVDNCGSIFNPSRSLLEDRQRDFTGRDYVFAAIEHFVASSECGYFTVQGDPGMGKTTALAELVRRRGLVAHFNIRAMGTAGIMAFQQSIIEQLAYRLQPEPRSTPTRDPVTDGQIVVELLRLAASRAESPVLVVVDALDEVDPLEALAGQNILLLPPELPPRIFCVLSQRNVSVPLRSTAPQQVLVMEDHGLANKADALCYTSKRLERLRDLLPPEADVERLAPALAEASAGNFMYLRFITDEISRSGWTLGGAAALPAGLEGYYRDHWLRMGMDERPPPEERLRIVYVLAELVGQATTRLIARFSGCSVVQVQSVLRDWSQFLHKEGQGEAAKYSIYHASFRDFLMQQDIVTAAAVSLPALRMHMGKMAFEQVFDHE